MHNAYTEFKKYLQFLSLEDQLLETDLYIDYLNNGKYPYTNIKRYIKDILIMSLKRCRFIII